METPYFLCEELARIDDTFNMAQGRQVVRIQIKLSLFIYTYTKFNNMVGISFLFYGKTRVMLCVYLHSEYEGRTKSFRVHFLKEDPEHLKIPLYRMSRK